MGVRLSELRCKEVINICTGQRMGYVSDVEFCLCDGKIEAIVVPGPCKLWGVLCRKEDYVIPCSCIRRLGSDIILVEVSSESCRVERPRPALL